MTIKIIERLFAKSNRKFKHNMNSYNKLLCVSIRPMVWTSAATMLSAKFYIPLGNSTQMSSIPLQIGQKEPICSKQTVKYP